jgi:toxin ParE1/3/4
LPDPFRFRRVTGFPYLLIYNAERPAPAILRVLHMARDLGPLPADLTATFDTNEEEPG